MENRGKIIVLHITPDNKFFDSVYSLWEKKESYENKAIYIGDINHQFKYIKKTDKVKVLCDRKKIIDYLRTEIYDIVFFHSLPIRLYQYVLKIPRNKVIIWWGWGYDLYSAPSGLCIEPMIRLNLFKPETKRYMDTRPCDMSELKRRLFRFCITPIIKYLRQRVLQRIDYFQPVLKTEYDKLLENKYFKAKEFYYGIGWAYDLEPCKNSKGNILLGNSASPTNNHLDILPIVHAHKQKEQKIIMPLSYGDEKYRDWLSVQINDNDVIQVLDFMPKDEYFKYLDNCSYAVFGTIRQMAMGNINYAIRKGIKVFLYKDSLVYKNHKELGFVVYTIEDINDTSFMTPLTQEEIAQNVLAAQKERDRKKKVYDSFFSEIELKLLD